METMETLRVVMPEGQEWTRGEDVVPLKPCPSEQNPEKDVTVLQQLATLLHAMKCTGHGTYTGSEQDNVCCLPQCENLQSVTTHLPRCRVNRDRTVTLCCTFRLITNHWRYCTVDKCEICLPLRRRQPGYQEKVAAAAAEASPSAPASLPVQRDSVICYAGKSPTSPVSGASSTSSAVPVSGPSTAAAAAENKEGEGLKQQFSILWHALHGQRIGSSTN